MSSELKANDVVVLRSGGRNMCISEISADHKLAKCYFADAKGKLTYEDYPTSTLQKLDDELLYPSTISLD